MALRLSGPAGTWTLGDGVAVIGRAADCQVRIKDPRLSRRHAQLVVEGGTVLIQELANTNGVLVNGDRIHGKRFVLHGDVVVCGPCVLNIAIDSTRAAPRQPPAPAPAPDPAPEPPPLIIDDDTEPMGTPVVPSTSGARHVDPAIVAAITVQTQIPGPAASQTLVPSMEPESVPSPLESTRSQPPPSLVPASPPAPAPAPTRPLHQSTSLLPGDFAPAESGPLLGQPSRALRLRVAAGLLDGSIIGLIAVAAFLAPMATGYGAALRQAGAVLEHGLPSLAAPGSPASLGELTGTLAHAAGWPRAIQLAAELKASAPGPFLTLFLGAAVGIVASIVIGLGLSVAPTVLHGGPFWHRRLGLRIVLVESGHPPGWGRAALRWLLLPMASPVAILMALLGRRGPHDWIAGTQVRSRAT